MWWGEKRRIRTLEGSWESNEECKAYKEKEIECQHGSRLAIRTAKTIRKFWRKVKKRRRRKEKGRVTR